jgi:membrane associated rhomboid family serine protease
MFPLGDASRKTARFPAVTAGLIVINAIVFLLELDKGDAFVNAWSLIPKDVSAGHRLVTILTSMFMHASWSHIIGNMIFLWAFGPETEDAMGPLRYAVFYLVGGTAGMLAQVAADPASTIPNLGASGAIAAVMGAFLITYPRDQIRTFIFFGFFVRLTLIPAIFLIGFWLVVQIVSFGVIADHQSGGVAYLAHIGGLLFGVATARVFEGFRTIERVE